jgi:hypothetical protein
MLSPRTRLPIVAMLFLTALSFGTAWAAEDGESGATDAEKQKQDEAKRLDELRPRLFAADLVVQASVTNVLPVGDKAIIVLAVREMFRGATARKAIYAETTQAAAAQIGQREAVWLLKSTDGDRHYTLDGPDDVLDAERAADVVKALETAAYATLSDLKLTVTLDKGAYRPDEPIRITWTIDNPTNNPIEVAEPTDWGIMLGLLLKGSTPDDTTALEPVVEIVPNTLTQREPTTVFRTLDPTRPNIHGSASLLRLVSSFSGKQRRGRPWLNPGRQELTLRADTSKVTEIPGVAVPKGAALGELRSEPVTFVITEGEPLSLDEAKALVAGFAGVDDLDQAIKSNDLVTRARTLQALVDYACPALLPLYEQMLRADDPIDRAVACSAITMWACHPAIVQARPFANLIDELPLDADLSLIARSIADVAEAQNDITAMPLLLRLMRVETVDTVSKRSVAISAAAIAGLQIDETNLEEAESIVKNWIEKHPDEVNASTPE